MYVQFDILGKEIKEKLKIYPLTLLRILKRNMYRKDRPLKHFWRKMDTAAESLSR